VSGDGLYHRWRCAALGKPGECRVAQVVKVQVGGQPGPLRGGAFIPDANILPASSLRWSSDRDGDLGTGAALDVVLSVGPPTSSRS
jgi:hypothetical protein